VLVKDDMARSDHPSHRKVVAAIPTVIRWIADEDAEGRSGVELVFGGRRKVGEAVAPKDMQLVVGGLDAEEESKRRRGAGRSAGSAFDEVCCHGERLGLERQWSYTCEEAWYVHNR
jgi:hypothetical protein